MDAFVHDRKIETAITATLCKQLFHAQDDLSLPNGSGKMKFMWNLNILNTDIAAETTTALPVGATPITSAVAALLRRRYLPLLLALVLVCALAWAWTGTGGGRPAAVVGGEVLRLADVDRRVALFAALTGHQTAAVDRAEARRQFTEMMIDETLILREARRRGLEPPPAWAEEANRGLLATLAPVGASGGEDPVDVRRRLRAAGVSEAYVREFARRQVTANLLISAVTANVRASEQEAADYYQANIEMFSQPEAARFRLLRVADPEAGARALAALRGGRDFGDLAREISLDPATRSSGGDTGWLLRGGGDGGDDGGVDGGVDGGKRLSGGLEAAAFALRPGQVSEVIQVAPGRWYLVKMEEYRPAYAYTLDQVREALYPELLRKKKMAAFEDFLEESRRQTRVRRLGV